MRDAETECRNAIEINSNFAEAHHNLSSILWKIGRPYEANDHGRKAIALKPHYSDAYYNLGISLFSVGHFKEGLKYMRQGRGVVVFKNNEGTPYIAG
jgi:Tfp pilus assembly protein PilF